MIRHVRNSYRFCYHHDQKPEAFLADFERHDQTPHFPGVFLGGAGFVPSTVYVCHQPDLIIDADQNKNYIVLIRIRIHRVVLLCHIIICESGISKTRCWASCWLEDSMHFFAW